MINIAGSVKRTMKVSREVLGRSIHESHREQVRLGFTVAADMGVHSPRPFIEWVNLGPKAKEGCRLNADYLIQLYKVAYVVDPDPKVEAELKREAKSEIN